MVTVPSPALGLLTVPRSKTTLRPASEGLALPAGSVCTVGLVGALQALAKPPGRVVVMPAEAAMFSQATKTRPRSRMSVRVRLLRVPPAGTMKVTS